MKAADDNLQTADGRKFDAQQARLLLQNIVATVIEMPEILRRFIPDSL